MTLSGLDLVSALMNSAGRNVSGSVLLTKLGSVEA